MKTSFLENSDFFCIEAISTFLLRLFLFFHGKHILYVFKQDFYHFEHFYMFFHEKHILYVFKQDFYHFEHIFYVFEQDFCHFKHICT